MVDLGRNTHTTVHELLTQQVASVHVSTLWSPLLLGSIAALASRRLVSCLRAVGGWWAGRRFNVAVDLVASQEVPRCVRRDDA